ncbi:MAG: hypothetical protein ACKVQS_07680 [Fimbriimonadaceae bacterium]
MSIVAFTKIGMVTAVAGIAALTYNLNTKPEPQFSPDEIALIKKFWSQPNRHVVTFLTDSEINGPYQARQTPEGSTWLLKYYKAKGSGGKIVPGQDPVPSSDRQKICDAWIESEYTWDEWQATIRSWDLNQRATGRKLPDPTPPTGKVPPQPEPIPVDLKELAGEPPVFVQAETPRLFKTTFRDFVHIAPDNTKVRRKYAYYRFKEGIMDGGTSIRPQLDKLAPLFAKAGVDESKLRIFSAVSSLEGGFDSINTYDTGYVSVGFIQFASLGGGAGSLGQVMLSMKKENPKDFQDNFRQFGLDVTNTGELVALNLDSGQIKVGPEANTEIINNRRYGSTFVRAGKLSEAFKLAQIRVAMDQYYPAEDMITIKINGTPQSGKIKDFISTEAGLATFMDRKVNTGKYGDLIPILESMAQEYEINSIKDFAKLEYQITRAMIWRKDYTAPDYALSKPRDLGLTKSRGGAGRNNGGTPPPAHQ